MIVLLEQMVPVVYVIFNSTAVVQKRGMQYIGAPHIGGGGGGHHFAEIIL